MLVFTIIYWKQRCWPSYVLVSYLIHGHALRFGFKPTRSHIRAGSTGTAHVLLAQWHRQLEKLSRIHVPIVSVTRRVFLMCVELPQKIGLLVLESTQHKSALNVLPCTHLRRTLRSVPSRNKGLNNLHIPKLPVDIFEQLYLLAQRPWDLQYLLSRNAR